MWFPVHTITQRQLNTLSQVGAWGDMDKPCQDMVFILIAPNLAIRCKWVFGLTATLMHPCQVYLPTLAEVAQKLMLLANEGTDWPYTYARMNDAVAHTPLSSEGHIGVMTGGLPSRNTCSHLYQLQVWQLLQCRGQVVCPEGLNRSLEPLLFNFKELPLWSMANTDEPTHDLPMMDVDLSNMVPEVSSFTRADNPLGLNLRGTLEQLCGLPLPLPTHPHSTSLPGHNHCQQPWDLLPQLGKQKIPLGLWEQSPLSLPQQ